MKLLIQIIRMYIDNSTNFSNLKILFAMNKRAIIPKRRIDNERQNA